MKSEHRKNQGGKSSYVSGILHDKDYICISQKWKKWAKRYLNKIFRKQKIPYEE